MVSGHTVSDSSDVDACMCWEGSDARALAAPGLALGVYVNTVGALAGLNAETLERAPTPVFGELVRSTAHGCSFARVQYMNCLQ